MYKVFKTSSTKQITTHIDTKKIEMYNVDMDNLKFNIYQAREWLKNSDRDIKEIEFILSNLNRGYSNLVYKYSDAANDFDYELFLDLVDAIPLPNRSFTYIVSIFNMVPVTPSFCQHIYENRLDSTIEKMINYSLNDKSAKGEDEYKICSFLYKIVNTPEEFTFLVEKNIIPFIIKNITDVNILEMIPKFLDQINRETLNDFFKAIKLNLNIIDELAITKMLKCVVSFYENRCDTSLFKIDKVFLNKLEGFIKPANFQLAKVSLQLIYYLEPFNIFETFFKYLGSYNTRGCNIAAANLLDKYYEIWKPKMTPQILEKVFSKIPNIYFDSQIIIFIPLLKYNVVGENTDTDFLILEKCIDYIDTQSDNELLLQQIVEIVEFYCSSEEVKEALTEKVDEALEKIDDIEMLSDSDFAQRLHELYLKLEEED